MQGNRFEIDPQVLRYSNTAVGLHCLNPLQRAQNARCQGRSPRVYVSALRPPGRTSARPHGRTDDGGGLIFGSELVYIG